MIAMTGKKLTLIAAAGMAFAVAAPAQAADAMSVSPPTHSQYAPVEVLGEMTAEHKRKRRPHKARGHAYGHRNNYDDRRYYDEPIYRDTRIWRGRDGQYYCRKENGTTGLLVGAGVGALAGNELAGRGDRTLGTLLGAVGGALLGREIDRSNSRCR
jgi:uncharacterized protein YcfJ